MLTRKMESQVRALLAECFNNPVRNAARAARAQYIGELVGATYRDGVAVVDREAGEWLRRLRELCGEHAAVVDIARWYDIERNRLVKLTGK